MIFYSAMVNAWSLLYDEIYGDDEMTDNTITSLESDEYDPIVTTSTNNTYTISGGTTVDFSDVNIGLTTASECTDSTFFIDTTQMGDISIDMSNYPGVATCGDAYSGGAEFVDYLTLNDVPTSNTVTFSDTPAPGIESNNPRKYKEDEAIKALQDYISTTYGGHYTSRENNVQTLDLIESVGDAESFCRSNAIKYLSRYDKKGQAKRDILKALHYSLLLYHFSGQLKETTTRGYETF